MVTYQAVMWMRTWLLVAAERREFDGIRKRLGSSRLRWPYRVEFACVSQYKGDRWVMIANGAGSEAASFGAGLASRFLSSDKAGLHLAGMISTGFCGALDPALRVGDIVENGLVCSDRVAV